MLIQNIRKISISKISLRQNSFFNQSSRVLFYRPSVDSVPIGNKYFVMCMLKLRKATIKYDNYWILRFDSRDSRNPETVRFTRLRNRAGTIPTLLKRSIATEKFHWQLRRQFCPEHGNVAKHSIELHFFELRFAYTFEEMSAWIYLEKCEKWCEFYTTI